MTEEEMWQAQQTARRHDPALVIVLILLSLLVVFGGIGLTSLLAYEYQQGRAGHIMPAGQPVVLPSGESPQMLYARVTGAPPIFADALTHSDMLLWDGDSCTAYSERGLSLSASSYKAGMSLCWSLSANLDNFAMQVKMTIMHGDEGGLLFRIDRDKVNMCVFTINTSGAFNVAIYGNPLTTLLHRPELAIKAGLGQPNVLTVIVQGRTALLYANDRYLGQITDANMPASGGIGLTAYDLLDPTTVVFSNLRVWKL